MDDRRSNVFPVLALVGGFVLALGLALGAFAVSFCSLFGSPCSSEEETTIGLLTMASLGVFILVPAAVSAARQQARWMLAPVIEVVLIAMVIALIDWF